MNRRRFLKRFGIGAAATAIIPAIGLDAIRLRPSAAVKTPVWQHFQAIKLVEGRKYLVRFDYKTTNNTPITVDVNTGGGHCFNGGSGFPMYRFHPKENANEITHLVIKETEFTVTDLSIKEIPCEPESKTSLKAYSEGRNTRMLNNQNRRLNHQRRAEHFNLTERNRKGVGSKLSIGFTGRNQRR